MFKINPFYITIILILIIGIVSAFYIKCKSENFQNHDYVQTLKTINEQKTENDEFMKKYNKYKTDEKEKNKDTVPYTWNNNNTIQSMKLEPCLANIPGSDRMTCYSAPLWWYPNNKYEPDNFRSIYYGDYYNPIYNYLGNAQELYWDFKSVKNTITPI